jgi:hypothetical protein
MSTVVIWAWHSRLLMIFWISHALQNSWVNHRCASAVRRLRMTPPGFAACVRPYVANQVIRSVICCVDRTQKAVMWPYFSHIEVCSCGYGQGQDLASGNLTAPVLFALEHDTAGPELLVSTVFHPSFFIVIFSTAKEAFISCVLFLSYCRLA